ncbi:cob(I)yrinic acid a,c-diamide adenosyltransferase [Paracrocinitomix mangrovi]|uniref:cob(I)yrinic acid a,c-diamide adenosyltransferase n=1 Tax=Paracrocinitomix mangrovi TaxID=2862509 RepID=UPI001C8DA032|nr:cob(I)yrinic acid a,c-diamide adenosyltransferase [Paracrocinitomix mangrovi]UKN03134.1 cob(I)yrinic acid a,c-diamide adenosyltransferase [Paracrocinitomix mangrovi]
MKIYTKKGDQGKTGLIGGTRVPKYALRIDAYGTVDELNSYMGLLRDTTVNEQFKEEIIFIQDRLFTLGSWLASDPEKSKMSLPELHESDIERLEKSIDKMDEELEPMKFFVLPGGHQNVSFCHIARCVCRRAERLVVELNENQPQNPIILAFLNRLSDYLFVYSRYLTMKLKAEEIPWKPNK